MFAGSNPARYPTTQDRVENLESEDSMHFITQPVRKEKGLDVRVSDDVKILLDQV